MAIWDEQWCRTPSAETLDHKVKEALKPVFDWCIKNNIPFEDFHYSVCTEAQELILLAILDKLSQPKQPTPKSYPIANNVSIGSVVITKNCLDVGLVAEVLHGRPMKIFGRYSPCHEPSDECPQYGGIHAVNWYDTGIHMSFDEWKELSHKNDANGFFDYWRTRLQIKK